MKRIISTLIIVLCVSLQLSSSQERHYSYRYIGTNYEAKDGMTPMKDEGSSCGLPAYITLTHLPDRKSVWLDNPGMEMKFTGDGEYSNGGYVFTAPLTNEELADIWFGGSIWPSPSLLVSSDYKKVLYVTYEKAGEESYYTRVDHYRFQSSVNAPHNSRRIEEERKETEVKRAKEEARKQEEERKRQQEQERTADEARHKATLNRPFPMADFIDSHGNPITSSFFKRGKKTLIVTRGLSAGPYHRLSLELHKYPDIEHQVVTIHIRPVDLSSPPIRPDLPVSETEIFLNTNEYRFGSWVFDKITPCLIMLDEWGNVLSYEYGYENNAEGVKHIMSLVEQLRIPERTYAPYKIGDYYNENGKTGVVFEVDADGRSGKILSLKHSETKIPWSTTSGPDIRKTFGVDDGSGIMSVVSSYIGWEDTFPAFSWCSRQGKGWYLPTISELKAIYRHRSEIDPKLTDKLTDYWACEDKSGSDAYLVKINDGLLYSWGKIYSLNVRAVSTFGKVSTAGIPKTKAPYKVGDFYYDGVRSGIVFEASEDGNEGKIVSMYEQGEASWTFSRDESDRLIGANSMIDGRHNLDAVKCRKDWDKYYPAFSTGTSDGDGWYLPAYLELKKLYDCHDLINNRLYEGFQNNIYCSSTEDTGPYGIVAFGLSFGDGSTVKFYKNGSFRIRQIATFGEEKQDRITRTPSPETSAPYRTGDYFNDGIKEGVVIETWNDGMCGKIISMSRSRLAWSCDESEQTRFAGSSNEADGMANRKVIGQIPDWRTKFPAADWCETLGEGWYLPSYIEIATVLENQPAFDSVNATLAEKGGEVLYGRDEEYHAYWTSTEAYGIVGKRYHTVCAATADGELKFEPKCNRNEVRAMAVFGDGSPRPSTTMIKEKTTGPYKVGDYYNDGTIDGIVAEVSGKGYHGKVISLRTPLMPLAWTVYDEYRRHIGAGSKTDGIKGMRAVTDTGADWRARYHAFRWCADLGQGWYLPSRKELLSIYENKVVLNSALTEMTGAALNGTYWSSSESNRKIEDCYLAWSVNLDDGTTEEKYKFNEYNICAIHLF